MNHIFIGNLYLFLSFLIFIFSGIIIIGVRLELFLVGVNNMIPDFFNSLITAHGLLMIFGAIMPSLFGLSYWSFCYLINDNKMFFFYLGLISFFLLFFSLYIILILNFLPIGFITTGWTMYLPLSYNMDYNIDIVIFSIIIISISSILNSLNLSFTIFNNFRYKLNNISIYFLSWLTSCYLIIISMPILIGLLIMVLLDKYCFTSFFNPISYGDVLLYQHIFWFFGHPEVYIIILPSFGIISKILPVFLKKKLFNYKIMVFSILSISIFSLITWGHHMFVTGMPILGQVFFMYCTMIISIPTSFKVFNWFFSIWNNNLNFETPILYLLGFIVFFIIGGFSGFLLSITPLNFYYHGTYFVVAHFHYILVSSTIFSILSFIYYLSPLITGLKYDNFKSKIHFWLSFFFFNLINFPMFFLGAKGMPRRYIDYPLKYIYYNQFITFNSVNFFFIQLYFLYFIFFPNFIYL